MKFSLSSLSLALSLCTAVQAGELTETGGLAQASRRPALAADLAEASGSAQVESPTLTVDLPQAEELVETDSNTQAGDLVQADSPAQDSDLTEADRPARVTDVMRDHGYDVRTWRDKLLVFSQGYEEDTAFVDIISFYPRCKAAIIETSKNDKEPEHKNKLSLTEVYNTLAKRRGAEPNEMRLVVFDVEKEDTETDKVIAEIRKGRNFGTWEEVRILLGEEEWDRILATEYYVKLLQVVNRPVQRIIIRTRYHTDRWNRVIYTNRIFFSLGPLERKTPVPGTTTEVSATETYPEVYEKDQEAEFMALLAEEDESEDELQAEMAHKRAN
ncbi:hypothetical protein CFIMG_007699RA00001 [Ceratocystis fimbriata CBS 114723]|uniref:Uncharacterized protein n=1 Tax=Ceratocystis fimbriata CBS 114723 TaxID=1035309 RepID=A0A2C5WV95_9PEZI|nr:hypothetical protein CFIMG_007699RA00001 [Ceratocystis fimbriata CBS 114723]